MKLVDLVSEFRLGRSFEDFCETLSLNAESEAIEIYAEEPVSIDSRLGFFAIEETGGRVRYLSNHVKYQNLFDFVYFIESRKSADAGRYPKDADLAKVLLSYALNDA